MQTDELTFVKELKRGDRDKRGELNVRRVQEWLNLCGYHVIIDGDFGAATEAAIISLNKLLSIEPTGVVSEKTFRELVLPMGRTLRQSVYPGLRSNALILEAERHVNVAREVGGQNMGPWVRLYMDGKEGASWPWCAGFVTFILNRIYDGQPPIAGSYSCDELAKHAMRRNFFVAGEEAVSGSKRIGRGSIFLMRKTPGDWMHTGFVSGVEDGVIKTVEGNTNDSGGREGYKVAARVRALKKNIDFIVFD